MLAVVIIGDIISSVLIIYGLMHKEKLLQFEEKLKVGFKRSIRAIKINLCVNCLKKEGFVVKKSGVE